MTTDIKISGVEKLRQAIIYGTSSIAVDVTKYELLKKTNVSALIIEALIPAMDKVVELCYKNVYFISDIMLCASALNHSLEAINAFLNTFKSIKKGKVLIGVVNGDLHDIGKNIVATILKTNHFEVIDLGVDIPQQTFINKVREEKPDILGIGASMSATMVQIKDIIDALKAEGLRDDLKIIVGGNCVTRKNAHSMGADGWGKNAIYIVELAKKIINEIQYDH